MILNSKNNDDYDDEYLSNKKTNLRGLITNIRRAKRKKMVKKNINRISKVIVRVSKSVVFIIVRFTKLGLNTFKTTYYIVKIIQNNKEIIVSILLSFQIYRTSINLNTNIKTQQEDITQQIETVNKKIDQTRRSRYIDGFLIPVSSNLILKISDGFVEATRNKAAELAVKSTGDMLFGTKSRNIVKEVKDLHEKNKELSGLHKKDRDIIEQKNKDIINLTAQVDTDKKQISANKIQFDLIDKEKQNYKTTTKKNVKVLRNVLIGTSNKLTQETEEHKKTLEALTKIKIEIERLSEDLNTKNKSNDKLISEIKEKDHLINSFKKKKILKRLNLNLKLPNYLQH